MSALTKVYEEIALERKRECTGCGGKEYLSHSHLVPRSRNKTLVTVKKNIVYHCLSVTNVGCHERFESIGAVTLNDFEHNFRIIHELDPEYFYLRIFKIMEFWQSLRRKDAAVMYQRAYKLYKEIENETSNKRGG